ncbi:MAG: sigma-70 family RNA polymerase sigma factor [Thermoanaerobaculales bacterium]|nr:sigma-70 family RNA polymerase sigma factor [Thermoanaerobaculales bacterium]
MASELFAGLTVAPKGLGGRLMPLREKSLRLCAFALISSGYRPSFKFLLQNRRIPLAGSGVVGLAEMAGKHRDEHWDEVAALVRLARSGKEDAFRQLLEMHRQAVTSTLFACGVRCPETASDLAQDVALRAWLRLDRLADARAFPAWLRRIAANAARDHLRRCAVRKEDCLEAAIAVESDDNPQDRAERVSEVRLMLAALESEEDEIQQLLQARADGVPIAVLARQAGIAEAAMKMRLMRVRKRLRKKLEELRKGGKLEG